MYYMGVLKFTVMFKLSVRYISESEFTWNGTSKDITLKEKIGIWQKQNAIFMSFLTF